MTTQVATQREESPQVVLRGQFDAMDSEIEKVLPEHVTLDRFKRIVLTAVNRNPDLMEADRRSLFAACLDAATDGLPPDGRDAALVVFKTKDKKTQTWIKKVQYMPMISGIYKKVRNAGEISTLSSHVVYTSDDFDYWIDEDGPHLKHTPFLTGDRGQVMLVYAVCKLKDGSVEIEAMTTAEIEEVRQVSRAKDSGPWATWWGEMARKTVVRRLSKRLPMSSDLERLMRRDDSMYDLDPEQRSAVDAPPRPKRVEYKPEPPAHGEDLDAQHRRVTKGTIPDDPQDETESASGETEAPKEGEAAAVQGRETVRTEATDVSADSMKAPAPAAEVTDNGGQSNGDGLAFEEPTNLMQKRLAWLIETSQGAQTRQDLEEWEASDNIRTAVDSLPGDLRTIWTKHIEGVREALAARS